MPQHPDTTATTQEYIAHIHMDEHTVVRRAAEIEHERASALSDLLAHNYFCVKELEQGPYYVHLSIKDNRLCLEISSEIVTSAYYITLPINPFRRVVKDYFLICESYFEAVKMNNNYRIEAIDMGRRGIHNEGSELLKDMLQGKVDMDLDTARRLFTLICVLHIR
jgi:uncharacterized protein (UPF0262 family)